MTGERGSTAGNQAVLAQKIDGLGAALKELKEMVSELAETVRELETREIRCGAQTGAGIEAVSGAVQRNTAQLREIEARVKINEAQVAKLMMAYGVMVFLGSAFGVSVMALIWALITGQAEVSFR